MPPEPPSLQARLAARTPPPGSRPIMRQRWEDLLFLHWRVEAAELRPFLPRGLIVDEFGGAAWLGIVPFFMRRVRPAGCPAVPWLSDFHELNVRTYVFDERGAPGVWFFSLDCDQPLAVWIARRFFQLPYEHARFRSRRKGAVQYRCRRPGKPGEARFHYRALSGFQEAAPGTAEFFLLERYLLFSSGKSGPLFTGRVAHAPYQYAAAEAREWSSLPAAWDGLPAPSRAPDHVCLARAVDVEILPLQRA